MEPYIYLFLFITFLAIISALDKRKGKRNLFFVFVSFFAIILFQSLRKWTVGIDVVTYLNFFERLSAESMMDFSSEFYTIETGFLIYNKLIAWFTSDKQIFLAIVSASIFIPIGYVIYKNSKNFYLSITALITLGIYNFTFSGLRQSIAIAIVFLSFEFIKKKKWFWFVLIVLLASSFHLSALVFLPAYPLYFLKIKKKHFLLVLGFIAIVFVFKSFLLKFFVSAAFEKYDSSELLVSTGAYTMFFIMLSIYSLSIFVQRKREFSVSLNAFSNYILMALLIQIAASESQVAMRAGYYYFIFITLLLPEIMATFKNKKGSDGLVFIMVVLCILFYYLTTSTSALNPYLFYWE